MSEHNHRHRTLASIPELRNFKVIASASARLFNTHFGASHKDWTPSKLRGLVIFGGHRKLHDGYTSDTTSDRIDGYKFYLVDLVNKALLWSLAVPEFPEYHLDRPFFHVVPGSSRLWGFLFDDDDESAKFFQKVTDRSRRHPTISFSKAPRAPGARVHFSKSIISGPAPNSFVHVAHVGIDAKGAIQSKGIDHSMSSLVRELQGYGVSQDIVEENIDFVEGFLKGAKASQKSTRDNCEKAVHSDHVPETRIPSRTGSRTIRRKPVVEFR